MVKKSERERERWKMGRERERRKMGTEKYSVITERSKFNRRYVSHETLFARPKKYICITIKTSLQQTISTTFFSDNYISDTE